MAPSSQRPPAKVALVGMMGTGKSSVAAGVAAALNWKAVDVDSEIEAQVGRSIAEIFASMGESGFREIEAAMIEIVFDRGEDCVVALGGGAVLTESTRNRLGECSAVVWLHAEPAVLARRLAGDTSRPMLAGDPLARLDALSREREDLYRSVATHDIEVNELSVDEVVAVVVDIIRDTVVIGLPDPARY
jgi:shikimate kinase